jgi:hypothetical protein
MRIPLMPALLVGAAFYGPAHGASMVNGPMTDDQIVASAESAAPASVAKQAKIIAFDAQMKMRVVREGKNGFVCMPDVPETPGPDPMCVDPGGMAWTDAWLAHKDPPKGVIGFGYMLAGGSDPDNMDPFATEPPKGLQWVSTGPHVMLFNVGDLVKNYPTDKQPDTAKPYVMYPNTPYAHIMMPVK